MCTLIDLIFHEGCIFGLMMMMVAGRGQKEWKVKEFIDWYCQPCQDHHSPKGFHWWTSFTKTSQRWSSPMDRQNQTRPSEQATYCLFFWNSFCNVGRVLEPFKSCTTHSNIFLFMQKLQCMSQCISHDLQHKNSTKIKAWCGSSDHLDQIAN